MKSACRAGLRALLHSAAALLTLAAMAGAVPAAVRAAEVTVFAAASLTDALEEIGQLYRTRGMGEVRQSFAASSTLARQIEGGAPAALFFSADEPWMDYLAERGLIVPETRVTPIGNRLVLIAPAERAPEPAEVGPGLPLAALLGDGRLATGDPEHVPVGRYAQQALAALGLWETAAPRLARADSVRAALALVERGEVPLGIVYATDAAAAPRVRVIGTFPEDSHAPIRYPLAVVAAQDGPEARAFHAFLTGPEAREVFQRYGFLTLLTN